MDIPVDTSIPVGRPPSTGDRKGPLHRPSPRSPLRAPTYPAERRWIETWRVIVGNYKARIGLIIVGFFILLAIFGPIILPQDPHTFTADILQPPSAAHWFGTTNFGEDVFVQTVVGARFSVLVGLGIGMVTTIISLLVGLTSAYFLR